MWESPDVTEIFKSKHTAAQCTPGVGGKNSVGPEASGLAGRGGRKRYGNYQTLIVHQWSPGALPFELAGFHCHLYSGS